MKKGQKKIYLKHMCVLLYALGHVDFSFENCFIEIIITESHLFLSSHTRFLIKFNIFSY